MGWCSATDIMDTALGAVEETLTRAYALLGVNPERITLDDVRPELDDVLRPFVGTLAAKLRENDWDCADESLYFERFAQEMHGHTDSEHRAWLVEMVKDTEGDQKWADALTAFNAKTGAQTSGR